MKLKLVVTACALTMVLVGIGVVVKAKMYVNIVDHTRRLIASRPDRAPRVLVPPQVHNAVNYPRPYPQWINAIGLTTVIDPKQAALHVKPYDAEAMTFYAGWRPQWTDIGNGIPGWGSQSNYAITSGPGTGFYFASDHDPTYHLMCEDRGYCGYSTNITNVHIPDGAETQNSGARNCDCHLYVIEPVGWKPTSGTGAPWPTLDASKGYQYEIDIQNAHPSTGCKPEASVGCTVFKGGGSLYGSGIAVFSTGSTGWYGGTTPTNDGFSPANTAPSGWGGSADHSNSPYTSLVITPQDILQGAIKHEVGIAPVCSEAPQPDLWPAAINGTDYSCHDSSNDGYHENLHGTGWSYGDHIWLDRTPAAIHNDVIDRELTPLQGILAENLATYGGVVFDNAGPFGPTFQVSTLNGDRSWLDVATKYGLPSTNETLGGVATSGILINLSLPLPYMMLYAHAIDSCVIQKACRS